MSVFDSIRDGNTRQLRMRPCRSRGRLAALELVAALLIVLGHSSGVHAESSEMPMTTNRPDHGASAAQHEGAPAYAPETPETPELPEGMTLDDVLDRAAEPPPADFPIPVPDDMLRFFVLGEQVEYRVQTGAGNELGLKGQGWVGFDYDRLWFKVEGEGGFVGRDEGGNEIDLLYSRLIVPFWNAQVGVQYGNGWEGDSYSDRWSGVLALQGLAPGLFEMDTSLYISQDGDVTAVFEGEYNIRFTQRLVLQPRTELSFAAQDVSERSLGAGMTDALLGLRLRYELKREIAPYLGVRYRVLVGETADQARSGGRDADDLFFVAGLRLAY